MTNLTARKLYAFAIVALIGLSVPSALPQRTQQAGAAQTQTAAPAQGSFCGSNPLCYESADFAATVTQFRTSTDASGNKLLDAILHFQNKTNQTVSLGYVDGSGSGLDDRGNRYGLNVGWGGVRGMGVISGNNLNPSFVLPPAGSGDVRFELIWVRPPSTAIIGVNYEIELDIREMNRAEANQWVLGSETLMHYQGLVNGVAAPVSSYNSAGAASPGSSNMSGVSGAGTATPSGSAPAGSAINNYAPSGVNNAIGGVTNALPNGYSQPNGYPQQNGYSQPNGYAPQNGYVPPPNGYAPAPTYVYTAPANSSTPAATVNTIAPANSTSVSTASTPASAMKSAVIPAAAVKTAITPRSQPAVTKAVVIVHEPAKPAPPAQLAKKPVPPPPPAQKTTKH
jgi:hypothetical protein